MGNSSELVAGWGSGMMSLSSHADLSVEPNSEYFRRHRAITAVQVVRFRYRCSVSNLMGGRLELLPRTHTSEGGAPKIRGMMTDLL